MAKPPITLRSPSGLEVQIQNGAISRISHGDVMINLFPGTIAEGGPTKLYLRRLGKSAVSLLGPGKTFRFGADSCSWSGEFEDLAFEVTLCLSPSRPEWFWQVSVQNNGATAAECDLILAHDLALAHEGAVRLNEYYVSHYIDHTPLTHSTHGVMVASRQNQSTGGRFPWVLLGSLGYAVSFGTDALQFHGLQTRAGLPPRALTENLPGSRLQHEHSMVALQEKGFPVSAGQKVQRAFFGIFQTDHPEATSVSDLSKVPQPPEFAGTTRPSTAPVAGSLFESAPLLKALELKEEELDRLFNGVRLHGERENGQLLSFFRETGSHVVLKAKELAVLRPHGHLLRTGDALVPDETAMTSTAWMNGVFHSMVTQGHVSINRLLSTCHGYLGFFRSHGQRVFVELNGRWELLDTPSAFEISRNHCRWIYRHNDGTISVEARAALDRHVLELQIDVLEGSATRFLISHHLAIDGELRETTPPRIKVDATSALISAAPDSDVSRRFPEGGFRVSATPCEKIGGDEMLFGNEQGSPFMCVLTDRTTSARVAIEGQLISGPTAPAEALNCRLFLQSERSPVPARLATIFPWFVHNALVHYLSPRGLEQYSGGGWGTRDVCQGPVELLLAHANFDPIRDVLLRVFRQQNPDGDWPQWFMFFERERDIRPGDSHGDIVFWPVLALAQYLEATGDSSILEEKAPFFGSQYAESIASHLDRALALMERRVIPGTCLAAYGHGDWNDSLQPVHPEMREKLCSAWTVTLHYQTLSTLARAMRSIGEQDQAAALESRARSVLQEFQSTLMSDNVVAGLAYFRETTPTLLLHPRDRETGISYSLLPMIHAIINGMFTPEQAKTHLSLIKEHLLGPDGARLFDRPIEYHGGLQRYFQRAESASYFGREIGLMYTHAHLRYCEALAYHGEAEEFLEMLCKINPIGLREVVPSAALRQSNCYYSSSDAMFPDRYTAAGQYDKVMRGETPFEGGWRVYSSGAGIAVRLIKQCFLGIRETAYAVVIDPAVPPSLDGLEARIDLLGSEFHIIYRVKAKGCGPTAVLLDGNPLPFEREHNHYRTGAAKIEAAALRSVLGAGAHRMEIVLG